jgi:transcriptional regulator with XRE-family HTH domain
MPVATHPVPFAPQRVAKAHLVLQGLTAREFAARTPWSEAWVYHVLNGRARPPEAFKREFARFVGAPVEVVFPDDSLGRAS